MPADSPPSLLITPDRRRRLQQQYDEARQLGSHEPPDFRRIHELLAACLKADPGNILYLDALLANLKRRDAAGRRPWRWWSGLSRLLPRWNRGQQAMGSTSYSALADAPATLWNRSGEPAAFHRVAEVAGHHDFDEAELRYLTAARELAPDDSETLRLLARVLTRQGRFEDAVGPWFAVLALSPGDAEAKQAVEDLRGVESTAEQTVMREGTAANSSESGAASLQQAAASQDAGQLDLAEHYYTRAQSALGGDLGLLEVRENLRLLKSQKRIQLAHLRAAHDGHSKAQSLVARLEQEHNRLEIDIHNIRAERLPADGLVRLELARRLKIAGNFSGAVERLEEALRLAPHEPGVLVELGECWQHLRQFAKALSYYEQAVGATSAGQNLPGDLLALARYRAGVLAAAMGRTEVARNHLAAVATLDPHFKDAAERLAALPVSKETQRTPEAASGLS